MATLTSLFLVFARIGLFTFGGGYAMIALIEEACVTEKNWISHDDMMNITVIAESTPGPIAINCATFVGYQQRGMIGAIIATLGIVLPSFFVILIIALLLDNFLEITIVAHAFWGIKLAVGILIIDAAITMIRKMKKKAFPVAVAAVSGLLMLVSNFLSLHVSSVVVMLTAGLISLALFSVQKIQKNKPADKRA